MSQIRLRQLRKWMVFLTIFNFLSMIACYVFYRIREIPWQGWATIITAIGFFIFYTISICGSGFQNVHKYIRAFLLLMPTILVLYITCNTIHLELLVSRYGKPLRCYYYDDYQCHFQYTNLFVALITALFVVIEIVATLAWGPLDRELAHRFRGAHGGYSQNANVILVSPDQPYQQQQQQPYYPQQQQQQVYHPQMQQLQLPPQQPVLIGPNVTPPSISPQQKQLPDLPLTNLPCTPSSTHTQSPIAATTTTTTGL